MLKLDEYCYGIEKDIPNFVEGLKERRLIREHVQSEAEMTERELERV